MGRFSFLTIIFLLSLLAISAMSPAETLAQDETWSVSAANWMQYWYFNDGGEFVEARRDSLDNRFIVDFDLGNFYTGAWLNIQQFNHPDESSETIAQRYFGWQEKNISVHLGNFYQVFDRGLTLNTFLDDAIYFDNNLDGVKISGNYQRFQFDALSARGLNSFTGERNYTVRGARGAVKPFKPVELGFSYVRFKQSSSDFFRTLNANMTSVHSSIWYGPMEFYAEYAQKIGRDDPFLPGANKNGDGTYLSGSINFEKISFYSEYKNYINLLYPEGAASFNSPPPVSHQGRSLMSLSNSPGERGYQVGTLISPSFDLNFDLSFSESFSRGIADTLTRLYLAEKFIGMRWSVSQSLVINYNWDRIDWTDEDETENYFDSYYYLGDRNVVSLTAYTKRFFNQFAGVGVTTEDYHENYLTLGYGMGNLLNLSIGGSISNNDGSDDPEKLAFVELSLRFSNNELVIFNGGERGGLICSSGICQTRPTFQGTRIVMFSRF